LSVGGATAGLLTTTFLPAAVASADNGVGTLGDIGNTALTSSTAGNGALGDAGALGSLANADAPTPTSLGDTGAVIPTASTPGDTSPLGDIGNTSPVGDTGAITPGATTPVATTPDATTPDATPGDTADPGAGDSFTLGDDTFNPVLADGSEGFSPVDPLFSAPPFFQVGQGEQDFVITDGTGSDATELGNVTASQDVSNLFGIHNTQFTITDVDPASGETASDLPTEGTVYDVANFGNGFENIYIAVPGEDGSASSITDTLVTPFGNFDIPTDFDATALLDPGDAFTGLSALGSDAAGGATDAATDAAGGATDAAGGATDAASDAAGGAADAAGGAADAAGGAGDAAADAATSIDPLSFLGF